MIIGTFFLLFDGIFSDYKYTFRVKVVQMSVQLANMLDKTVESCVFFPVTDLMTYFGKLVYDRLVSKSPQLKINFSYEDVSPQAKELCKNWLYKIASIRGPFFNIITY